MSKKIKKVLFVLLICTACLAGCNKTINDVLGSLRGTFDESPGEDWSAVKLNRDAAYYNDFLGISYTVPKGWWLYEASAENLDESKGVITDDILMELIYDNYEGYVSTNAWLMFFGNLEKSSQDNHLGFDLDARSLDGITDIAGFMKYFEIYMLEPTDEETYSLIDSRQAVIKGKPFEIRNYLVTRDKEENFCVMTLSCQVKNGYFLNIKADYWADNTKAKDAIIDSVSKAIEFY